MARLFTPVALLLCCSFLILSSISSKLFYLQLTWTAIGVATIGIFILIDWRTIFHYRWFALLLYGVSVCLLIVVVVYGAAIRNVQGWLTIGAASFQPVELAKVALIVVYAQYFARRHIIIARLSSIINSFIIVVIPFALTLLQPDLGSALILVGIWIGFLLASGLPWRYIASALALVVIVSPLIWIYGLRPYQKERIAGVFYPEKNALTVNYSVIQSRIAIGSAGWWGKGYGQGTQTQLGFLSEPANDFVFSAFIEEWGWLGGVVVLGAFIALEGAVLSIGVFAHSNFEKLLCLGTAIVWAINFAINTGSATGLFPVIGVTFPFLSYGGSSLLINFLLLAIINSIRRLQYS